MDPIIRWLIDVAMSVNTHEVLLDGICERLVADGVPVVRGNISLSVIDPVFRARACTWRPAVATNVSAIPHDREPGAFETSPIGFMLKGGETVHHWLATAENRRKFAVIDDIAALGGTDYMVALHPFASEDFKGLRGIGLSIASSRPGGLTAAEQARIRAIGEVLAPIAYRITLADMALSLMDAYVGRPASRRILSGQVRRGEGETIDAVLLLADLRGFTSMADASDPGLIERLDEHFEAMVAPVISRGGSVLKFMGDGILAVFPVTDALSKTQACRLALAAARDALDRTTTVNSRRRAEAPLHLDIALNDGEVFYGNVGAPGRLDFTVIGPAVNVLSRIGALGKSLGHSMVMSAGVAAEVDVANLSLGHHRLRGVETEREIFAAV